MSAEEASVERAPERAETEENEDAREAAEARKARPFGGLTPAEAAQRRAAKAREARAEREREATLATLTVRQRLGLSLAKLSQAQLDAVVQALADRAAKGEEKAVHALARLSDQAFGKAQPEEEEDTSDVDKLSRAARAAMLARLLEEEERDRVLGEGVGEEARD